jgi:hypothetical protein
MITFTSNLKITPSVRWMSLSSQMITSKHVLIHPIDFIYVNIQLVDNILSASNWMITSLLSSSQMIITNVKYNIVILPNDNTNDTILPDDKTEFNHPAIWYIKPNMIDSVLAYTRRQHFPLHYVSSLGWMILLFWTCCDIIWLDDNIDIIICCMTIYVDVIMWLDDNILLTIQYYHPVGWKHVVLSTDWMIT